MELPRRDSVVEERTVVGLMTSRMETPRSRAAADWIRRKEDRSGIFVFLGVGMVGGNQY